MSVKTAPQGVGLFVAYFPGEDEMFNKLQPRFLSTQPFVIKDKNISGCLMNWRVLI